MSGWDEEEARERAAKDFGSMWEELQRLEERASAMIVRRVRRASHQAPEGWAEVCSQPIPAVKTRVTLRLDADVAEWFRAQGPGHQTRMNAVLRAFMLSRKAWPA